MNENEVKQNASGIKGIQEWSKQHTVNVTLEDIGESGVAQPFKYLWAQGTTGTNGYKTETEFITAYDSATGGRKGTFNNGDAITTNADIEINNLVSFCLYKPIKN